MSSRRRLSLRAKLMLIGGATTALVALILTAVNHWQGERIQTIAANEAVRLAHDGIEQTVRGIKLVVSTQQEVLEQKVLSDLKVAQEVLRQSGEARSGTDTVSWTAINQFTRATETVTLPRLMVGDAWLGQTVDPAQPVAVVDKVRSLVGGTCTLFQRMNEAGDMLRVATNVMTKEGRRAIGTFIPTRQADGTPSAILQKVIAGEVYVGRAFVVNQWYVAAYAPLKDAGNQVVGMIYVGVPQESASTLRKAVTDIIIGQSGYAYILDPQGRYVISHKGKRDGENIWEAKDTDGNLFIQDIVSRAKKLKPGETALASYPWKNPGDAAARQKTVSFTYYEPWQWIIAAGTWDEEFYAGVKQMDDATHASRRLLWAVLAGALLLVVVLWYFIARKLAAVITQTAQKLGLGSGLVSAASGQVSAASQALAEGSSEQAATLEEISSSLEELSSMTKSNAENAQAGKASAGHARSAAEAGVAEMQQMQVAMNAIQQSSNDISIIIKTIDEIAFQTNILALNAAVEAARAGEAGAGFAVVADEVRSLAQRSALAAKETEAKIAEATARSAQGVQLSTRVASGFGQILEKAREVDRLVAEVAKASQEQSSGLTQINQAVTQLDQVTQNNAAGAEETAAAATELNTQSANLRDAARELAELVGIELKEAEAAHPVARRQKTISPAPASSHASRPVRASSHRLTE